MLFVHVWKGTLRKGSFGRRQSACRSLLGRLAQPVFPIARTPGSSWGCRAWAQCEQDLSAVAAKHQDRAAGRAEPAVPSEEVPLSTKRGMSRASA